MSQGTRTRLHLIAKHTALPDKVAEARKRYGKPFAHEPGSSYKPNQTPVLLQWLARIKGRKA